MLCDKFDTMPIIRKELPMKRIVSFFISKLSRKKNDDFSEETAAVSEFPDDELVAVVTAAIQTSMKAGSQNSLVIKSIRRSGQASPIWNKTGRLEHISKKL
jgi:hypothetical protein